MKKLKSLRANWFSQRGQASMVTVAMFMMLFAAIAVSFTYIVVTASRQATNDSLQSAAKAAADSGVEDAKRILVYCYSVRNADGDFTADSALCKKVIGLYMNDEAIRCNDVLGALKDSSIGHNFELGEDGQGGIWGGVGNKIDPKAKTGSANEYYQCLKIFTRSPNYEGMATTGGSSAIVPMRLVDGNGKKAAADRIVVKWHYNIDSQEGDHPSTTPLPGDYFPTQSTWGGGGKTGTNRPAVLRVEQVKVPYSGATVDNLIANDTAVTLRPSTSGTSSVDMWSYLGKFNTNQYGTAANSGSKIPLEAVTCNNIGASTGYACTVNLGQSPLMDNNTADYYMRFTAIYNNAHFELTAYRGNEQLYFDGVQPIIDVTGKSADSFSRIKARLKPAYTEDDDRWYPETAIETGGKICKNLRVYWDDGYDDCKYPD